MMSSNDLNKPIGIVSNRKLYAINDVDVRLISRPACAVLY